MVNGEYGVWAVSDQKPSPPQSSLSARAKTCPQARIQPEGRVVVGDALVGWVKGSERIVHQTFGRQLRGERHEQC